MPDDLQGFLFPSCCIFFQSPAPMPYLPDNLHDTDIALQNRPPGDASSVYVLLPDARGREPAFLPYKRLHRFLYRSYSRRSYPCLWQPPMSILRMRLRLHPCPICKEHRKPFSTFPRKDNSPSPASELYILFSNCSYPFPAQGTISRYRLKSDWPDPQLQIHPCLCLLDPDRYYWLLPYGNRPYIPL